MSNKGSCTYDLSTENTTLKDCKMTYTRTYPHYPQKKRKTDIELCRIKANECFVNNANFETFLLNMTRKKKRTNKLKCLNIEQKVASRLYSML